MTRSRATTGVGVGGQLVTEKPRSPGVVLQQLDCCSVCATGWHAGEATILDGNCLPDLGPVDNIALGPLAEPWAAVDSAGLTEAGTTAPGAVDVERIRGARINFAVAEPNDDTASR